MLSSLFKKIRYQNKDHKVIKFCFIKIEIHIRTISEKIAKQLISKDLYEYIICKFVPMHTIVLQAQH